MKAIFILLLVSLIPCAADVPILTFNDRLTWKQVFDSGLRPKHLEGLEDHKCICQNQRLWLQFKNRDLKFQLDSGRVQFGFFYDDFLQMLWHQGADPITLEEGRRRADEFRKLFDGYIIQEITMPRLIDPSGLVDAGNDENNVKVRVGEYLIWYGFDNSLRKDKPIIPHFYITWNFPGRPDVRLKDSGDVVRPPKGYEWYSLDPKVSTPDPASTADPLAPAGVVVPEQKTLAQSKNETKTVKPEKAKAAMDESRLRWWLIGILGTVIAIVLVRRLKSKSSL